MRRRTYIALFLVLLALFSIDAISVNWDDPESQTVDEMFAGDYGSVYGGLSFTSPQDSRAAQAGEPNKEIINLPIGGNHSTATASSQQTESQGQPQAIATQHVVANVAAQNQPRPTSASGTWRLEMRGDVSRNATLMLFQSGDTVFGKGEIKDGNNTALAATASGVVAADKITLDMVTPEKIGLYRLLLTISGDSAVGSYTEFSTNEEPVTGTVNGLRIILKS
jgi:hypothetical protein